MPAATQHVLGTMHDPPRRVGGTVPSREGARGAPVVVAAARITAMNPTPHRQFHIHGVTLDGRRFRPSDWAERLAGAMSSFRPGGGAGGIGAHIGYSPYCVPHSLDGDRGVLVSDALRDIEPMAWDFVMNFARDNALKVTELPPGTAAT